VSAPDQQLARRKYEQLAPAYDRLVRPAARLRRLAVDRLELKLGDSVLDVGCGTGLSFSLIGERIGPEGRLIGVDLSPDMLAKARERVERHGWGNVTLVESAVEDADIPEGIDACISVLTHDVMRSPVALSNVVRRLKPGGRIVVTGAKWSSRWALPVNAYVWWVARRYITTFEGFRHPWSHLQSLVPDLRVEPLFFGGAYVASGTASRSDQAQEPA
jgi:demethylmenaquinone methyltransferase/2-methoxy-6-polyprenyl-1,4-benzoquinol methylase